MLALPLSSPVTLGEAQSLSCVSSIAHEMGEQSISAKLTDTDEGKFLRFSCQPWLVYLWLPPSLQVPLELFSPRLWEKAVVKGLESISIKPSPSLLLQAKLYKVPAEDHPLGTL